MARKFQSKFTVADPFVPLQIAVPHKREHRPAAEAGRKAGVDDERSPQPQQGEKAQHPKGGVNHRPRVQLVFLEIIIHGWLP